MRNKYKTKHVFVIIMTNIKNIIKKVISYPRELKYFVDNAYVK